MCINDKELRTRVDQLCALHSLPPTVSISLINANRGKFNPYHNNFHMLFVAERCSDALKSDEFAHLRGTASEQALILAALFHDFHHSGGFSSDIINVSRAIAYVSKHLKSMYNSACVEEICRNIWTTCYSDGVFMHPPTTDSQKILRDADLMQLFRQFEVRDLMIPGLIGELRVSGTIPKERLWVTIEEFSAENDEFLSKQVFYTNWGQTEYNRHCTLGAQNAQTGN